MKRVPLRKISPEQAKEYREWAKIKKERCALLLERYEYVPCEWCKGDVRYPDGHHVNHDRRQNTLEECRIVHRGCHRIIEDGNIKDVESLLREAEDALEPPPDAKARHKESVKAIRRGNNLSKVRKGGSKK